MSRPTTYKVKRPEPFPPGTLYLDSNGMGGAYMGKAASRNDAGEYPAYRLHSIIRLREAGDYDSPGQEIGYIKGWTFRTGLGLGRGFHAMADSLGGESTDAVRHMAHALCDEDGYWLDVDYDEEMGDLMFIQEIYVQPRYRGYGVSLLALNRMMTIPGHEQIRIVIDSRPFTPYQFSDRSDRFAVAASPEKRSTASKALGKHWSLLSFKRRPVQGDAEYWIRWRGYTRPHIRNVLPHLVK